MYAQSPILLHPCRWLVGSGGLTAMSGKGVAAHIFIPIFSSFLSFPFGARCGPLHTCTTSIVNFFYRITFNIRTAYVSKAEKKPTGTGRCIRIRIRLETSSAALVCTVSARASAERTTHNNFQDPGLRNDARWLRRFGAGNRRVQVDELRPPSL